MIKKDAIFDFFSTYGLIAVLVVGSFWVAATFVEPAPEKKVVMAAGSKGGAYYKYAQEYKQRIAAYGVEIEVLETKGSDENLELVHSGKADVAFVQSGISDDADRKKMEALSSLYYEPLWVFVKKSLIGKVDELRDFKGMRVAVGTEGSGTYKVVKQVLEANGVQAEDAEFLSISSGQAIEKGDVDVIFLVAGLEADSVWKIFHHQGYEVMNVRRAAAYEKNFAFLSKVTLEEGVVDLKMNIPAQDIDLVSPVAMMVADKDLHASLKTLVVKVGSDIFSKKVPFKGEPGFPSQRYVDFDLSPEADRFFKDGFGFLNQVLPFWIADMIGRLKVMLIPLLAVFLPLAKVAAPTYKWRIRSRIYRWYKKLHSWESSTTKDEIEAALEELRAIDEEVRTTNVPLSYNDEVYNLRMHIELVKEKLKKNL